MGAIALANRSISRPINYSICFFVALVYFTSLTTRPLLIHSPLYVLYLYYFFRLFVYAGICVNSRHVVVRKKKYIVALHREAQRGVWHLKYDFAVVFSSLFLVQNCVCHLSRPAVSTDNKLWFKQRHKMSCFILFSAIVFEKMPNLSHTSIIISPFSTLLTTIYI